MEWRLKQFQAPNRVSLRNKALIQNTLTIGMNNRVLNFRLKYNTLASADDAK
ncbi:MAG: hypothetical protein WCA84_03560 [Ignavibacteriaceae bacterium]